MWPRRVLSWRIRRRSAPIDLAQDGERREPPMDLLQRLHWTVLRPLALELGGDERSLLCGPGMELAEVREYQPGDDVRFIDWNLTGRTGRPFVREAYTERALDVWLVLDTSASVDWGTVRCLKRDVAVEFAALAGQVLGRRGNRVGALLFAERPLQVLPPRGGRVHLLRLLAHLRAQPVRQLCGGTDLAAALTTAERIVRRRARAGRVRFPGSPWLAAAASPAGATA